MTKVQKTIKKIASKSKSFLETIKKRSVLSHKKRLLDARDNYNEFPDVLFVFQTYNKGFSLKEVLSPFLSLGVQNVLLFADGCIDKSAEVSHSLLLGPRHYVVSCNDLHEISNYRLAIKYAEFFNCKYLVLLQDDDIYDKYELYKWLVDALELFAVHRCSMIGGNGAAQIDPDFEYKFADSSIQSAEFLSGKREDGLGFHQLGNIERWIEPVLGNKAVDNKLSFVASVNRAPQIIDARVAKNLDFFPKALEPFQYDDYWNCFSSWMSDYSVIWMPIKGKSFNGSGGMRLYNDVKPRSRPAFFANNWNFFLNNFRDSFDAIAKKVREANERM